MIGYLIWPIVMYNTSKYFGTFSILCGPISAVIYFMIWILTKENDD